jgi:putative two-component system response regulator
LVVEDDTGVPGLLVEALREEGYRALARASARAVADALADPPDLVLLEVVRPGLDGAALCRRLNADPRTRDVPVVFVTATPSDLFDARTVGCRYAGVIPLPFTLAQALATVRRLLLEGGRAGPGARRAGSAAG